MEKVFPARLMVLKLISEQCKYFISTCVHIFCSLCFILFCLQTNDISLTAFTARKNLGFIAMVTFVASSIHYCNSSFPTRNCPLLKTGMDTSTSLSLTPMLLALMIFYLVPRYERCSNVVRLVHPTVSSLLR